MALVVRNLPVSSGHVRDTVCSLSQEDPLEEGTATHPQCSYLENPMDRVAWQATVHGVVRVGHNLVTKERKRERCLKINQMLPSSLRFPTVTKMAETSSLDMKF